MQMTQTTLKRLRRHTKDLNDTQKTQTTLKRLKRHSDDSKDTQKTQTTLKVRIGEYSLTVCTIKFAENPLTMQTFVFGANIRRVASQNTPLSQ
jgi:hypothetical protein